MKKIITELLKNVLLDIENLKNYHDSQEKHVFLYVKDNMKKYRYGLLIDRFFLEKVRGIEKSELTKEQLDEVNEIISDYDIVDGGENKSIIYRLNPKRDFSKYEMDPKTARAEAMALAEQPMILKESMIIMLLIKYEDAIAELFRFLLEAHPEAYLAEKSIKYSELISFEGGLEEIKEKLINKEVEEFMWKSLQDWYRSFKTKYKVDFHFGPGDLECFTEIYYRRNLIVHTQGVVNETYKKNIVNSQAKIGDVLGVDAHYLDNAFSVSKRILIGTVWGLRKVADDSDALNSFLFLYGYDCLKREEWDISKYVYDLLLREDNQSEADRICEKVNLWLSIKNIEGIAAIEKEVNKLDISAMSLKFHVAKYALLDDYNMVTACLKEGIKGEVNVQEIKEWPLLARYRETEQYSLFAEQHKALFESNGYGSDDVTDDGSDDILEELGGEPDNNQSTNEL